ncbi:Endoribonuclease MazF4 [Austwickia sp. TVS 96-490-7B]|uniref:type II toxin-antitoxin system PemK/MazF family toxin n=1 Tax=Austwickia sp. TVS 96-490-7B TaxID=2830843 RepID=UPI001C55B909|nr:type II toxin-antitoxin system PemK/MazF family toxin [Austwickia sp. TVS 96-490-7B]MBW3086259.1 Endoribonuclease MazF4 [Austwickia sp. TVS 96-490-7B]
MIWPLQRGRIYVATLGSLEEKFYLVVSNNQRNRFLDSVLAVRLTTSSKPPLPSIVEIDPTRDRGFEGRIVCDDIVEIFEDEVARDLGALSPETMRKVDIGLRAALGIR